MLASKTMPLKPQVLVLNHPRSPPLRVNNIGFDSVDDFNYLGSYIATT